jgi:hypothetical protein
MKRLNLIFMISIAVSLLLSLNSAVGAQTQDKHPGSKPHDAPVDMDGDGKTDWVIIRTATQLGAPMMWYCAMNSGRIESPMGWGWPPYWNPHDYPLTGDFDGDGRDDIATWRPGPGDQGHFYVVNSATMTITVVDLGTTGDNPMIVGDYNGDRRDDFAVYRKALGLKGPSHWYYITEPGTHYTAIPFGQSDDVPAPGDYDSDRKDDLAVVHYSNNQTAVYHMLLSSGAYTTAEFPLPANNSVPVPGDYDGDFHTDMAAATIVDGEILWSYLSSRTGEMHEAYWGYAPGTNLDFLVPGDYDGDGRIDFAVWRKNIGRFYVLTTGSGEIIVKDWGGASSDYPVANFMKGPCTSCLPF